MYDIIIIGAGTAGISAYKQAIKSTTNLLIINEGDWDTTCARVGCMPSKVLISTANRLNDINTSERVGLKIESRADTSEVMQHVRKLRDRFTHATLNDVDTWPDQHKISGRATFINANTIQVNDQHYQAKSFIIAVGSTPSIDPSLKEKIGDRLITSNQVFELDQLPKSIAIIGSGVIALELAQAFNQLSVHTTVFARSRRIGVLSSPVLQDLAQKVIGNDLNILFETLPDEVNLTAGGLEINYKESGQPKKLVVDYLLAATGRKSLLERLDLQYIDASFKDLKNLPIDKKTKQLADLPIFIVGDAYTDTPLQHEAAHEGKKAVDNCLNYPQVKSLKTLTPLGIVFSQPEMAIIGHSHKQLTHSNTGFVRGYASFERQGRAIVLGKNVGAIELYIDIQTRLILGAELFMYGAEHLAHFVALCIGQKISIDQILSQPFYHPTLEEGLRTALKHARRELDALNVS